MILPKQIKKIREGLNLSQRELAKRMEVPQSTVVRIESGEMNISQATIDKFCNATNCTILIISNAQKKENNESLFLENLNLKTKLKNILAIISNIET